MKLNLTGRHMDVGQALKQHVADHLNKVAEKYFHNPIEAHVVFNKENSRICVDIQAHAARGIIAQVKSDAGDAYSAFDQAMSKLEARLRRYKTRLRDHQGPSHEEMAQMLQAQQYVLAHDGEDQAPDQPLVIAEMTMGIETLTVSEAVMRLDLSDSPALMFRNRGHGGLNVIYRRPDGNIGWIDPEGASTMAA
ncbi:MAG: ribosome-associated translation inhibitor RaiA [Dongiaceae bacterium]